MIFDSHWFTTGYHLVDGGSHYKGTYISDEMPWYLYGVPYDYRGHPQLALDIEAVSREMGGYNRAITHSDLGRHYATVQPDQAPARRAKQHAGGDRELMPWACRTSATPIRAACCA